MDSNHVTFASTSRSQDFDQGDENRLSWRIVTVAITEER